MKINNKIHQQGPPLNVISKEGSSEYLPTTEKTAFARNKLDLHKQFLLIILLDIGFLKKDIAFIIGCHETSVRKHNKKLDEYLKEINIDYLKRSFLYHLEDIKKDFPNLNILDKKEKGKIYISSNTGDRTEDVYKIGITRNPIKQRLRNYQTPLLDKSHFFLYITETFYFKEIEQKVLSYIKNLTKTVPLIELSGETVKIPKEIYWIRNPFPEELIEKLIDMYDRHFKKWSNLLFETSYDELKKNPDIKTINNIEVEESIICDKDRLLLSIKEQIKKTACLQEKVENTKKPIYGPEKLDRNRLLKEILVIRIDLEDKYKKLNGNNKELNINLGNYILKYLNQLNRSIFI